MLGFSRIAAPLHEVSGGRKGKAWNDEQKDAFEELKAVLTRAPVVAYPRFEMEVDAFFRGLGACLLQRDDDNKLHPIAICSRTLRGVEKNYPNLSSFKVELLALKWAVTKKFGPYIAGSCCVVWTDHNPLAHLKSARAGATEMRWMAQLAPYDIEIRYQPGGINECADALSRRPDMPGNNMLVREVTSYVALSREPILVQQVTGTVDPLTPEEVKPRPSVVPSFTPSELQDLQRRILPYPRSLTCTRIIGSQERSMPETHQASKDGFESGILLLLLLMIWQSPGLPGIVLSKRMASYTVR